MSESSARATLQAVKEDLDRSKWGHHQWIRTDAIIELSEALGIEPTNVPPTRKETHGTE